MTNSQATGTLYIVPTPLGNREDMTFRSIAILKSVDFILAEDTRHSLPLMQYYGIEKPLISMHAHNENEKTQEMVGKLLEGYSAALISDAGTPLISDPGFPLVKSAREKGIEVVPLPGPCACITALSGAGIPCDVFTFGGFLPAKSAARCKKLEMLGQLNQTLVFYESTHRIIESLEDIGTVFGSETSVIIAKELTKTYERFISGSVPEVLEWLLSVDAHVKGEFVLIIPAREIESNDDSVMKTLEVLMTELPVKQAVKLTVAITGAPKNQVYKLALGDT